MPVPPPISTSSAVCEVCGRKDRVFRCSGCRAVFYCGQDHQSSDRPRHRRGCARVKAARDVYEQEEQAIRETGDPVDMFEGPTDTGTYISARFLLADALLKNFGTVHPREEAVGTALNHLLTLLAFNRADPLFLRTVIPALYIVLGKQQHTYDFVKWWATKYTLDPEVNWNDPNMPYLDIRDADIFEPPVEEWRRSEGREFHLSHPVIVMVLKLRVLLDLVAVQNARRFLRGLLPAELIGLVQDNLVDPGSIVAHRPEILRGTTANISSHIMTLRRQIKQLYDDIAQENHDFWPLMFAAFRDPAAAVMNRPIGYTREPEEEARYAVGYTIAGWLVEPLTMGLMKGISAAVDS